jgi:6-phosphogluconolactonase
VEKLAAWRITLTPAVLDRAAAVIFLVQGEEKAEALRAVLEGERDPDRHPAQIVRPESGEILWLVDDAAASRLRLEF